jgi:DNA-binding response OmpR family regulator
MLRMHCRRHTSAVTRRIKADASLRSIPIIAVTSYALSGEEKKARVAGCDDYVPKPFSPRQLLAKIRQHCAMHESAFGTKRTSSCRLPMSAFGGKADIAISKRHVRF